ncbi:MAG: transposase [Spirochaetes bacterium]|nr:transposase [Spirochaetota bacterium]
MQSSSESGYHKHLFYGYRKITKAIKDMGYIINRKRVLRLMRKMGIQAVGISSIYANLIIEKQKMLSCQPGLKSQ